MTAIQTIIKTSKRLVKNQWIDIKITPAKEREGRLIVIAPRKAGNAVARNQFKRRVRAIFREKKLNQTKFDWVFFAKPEVRSCSYKALQDLVSAGLHQLSQ